MKKISKKSRDELKFTPKVSEKERKRQKEMMIDCLSVSGSYPNTERNEFYTEIKRNLRDIH